MSRRYPFFFMHTEARNDAKLRSLTDAQFRTWFNLLCLAAEQPDPDRGTIRGMTRHLLAVEVAGGDTELLVTTCIALQALRIAEWRDKGVSDAGNGGDGAGNGGEMVELAFLNFDARQRAKPSDDPERVRERVQKSRARKTSGDVTPCNAPVSRYSDTVTPGNTQEEYKEREEYNPPLPPPGGVGDGGEPQPSPIPAGMAAPQPAPLPTIPAAPPVTGPIRPAPAIPNTPDPTTLANLEAIARSSLGDRGAIEDYPMKIDGWLRSYPADWVRDAILCTAARDGIRPGGLAQYTAACLRRWHPNGPPRGEVESARRKADRTPAPVYKVFKDDGLFADTDREVLRRRREAKQA